MNCPDPGLLADGYRWSSYWSRFVNHWSEFLGEQNGVVVTALVVAAASAFIITRGKWRK